ncbi:MAG: hypothetical protein QGH51_04240 [Planctomycetota bacterium]|jgi:hypothetical protein|nr:hypothetical protein [Planctomycetota bacterium]MDP6941219.1 hypothetical protein [Planctomycetota bacterium]
MKTLTRSRILLATLGLTLAVGLVPMLPAVWDGIGGSAGRGDNPVVGSLPCVVDPRLDDLFWIPNGFPEPPAPFLSGLPPVAAVMGNTNLSGTLLGAAGQPYGFLDDYENWSHLGMVKRTVLTMDRASVAASQVAMWQFLPAGFIGGEVEFILDGTLTVTPIVGQLLPIQLMEIANLPVSVGTATITFLPNAANLSLSEIRVQVSFHNGTLNIQYQP